MYCAFITVVSSYFLVVVEQHEKDITQFEIHKKNINDFVL